MAPPRMSLKFLGTSSMPNASRNYSSPFEVALGDHVPCIATYLSVSVLFKVDNHTVMVDCGESTQRQFQARYVGGDEKLANLRTILVTHLHADHVLGIVPLLTTMMGPSGASTASNETARIEIFGPRGIRALIRTTLTLCYSRLTGKYVVHELVWPAQGAGGTELASDPTGPASLLDFPQRPIPTLPLHESELPGRDISMQQDSLSWPRFASFKAHGQSPRVHISAAPITHRCPTVGYTFEEEWGASALDPSIPELLKANSQALLHERNIRNPLSLLPRLVNHRESILLPDGTMLHPPPLDLPGRKVTVLGDTSDATGGLAQGTSAPQRGMAALAQNSDVLVHECTNIALPQSLTKDGKDQSRAEARSKAAERGHSTPQVAGAFAAHIKAGNLILNHFSVRYPSPPHYLLGNSSPSATAPQRDDTAENQDRASDQDGPLSRQLSEPERRVLVMREFERQAAKSWHSSSMAAGGHEQGHQQGPHQLKVTAAFDGYVHEVPARPRVAVEHVPFSRAGDPWNNAKDASPKGGPAKRHQKLLGKLESPSTPRYKSKQEDWDPSPYLLDHVASREAHAVILLNSPIAEEHKHHFVRMWESARYRLCADGAANRLVEAFGFDRFTKGASSPLLRPHAIVGDLDSVRPEVKTFFSSQGVKILVRPSQYATDLQKCVQAVEDYESEAGNGNEMTLLVFGGLSGRFDQSVHTLHVLWQLAPGAADLGGVENPGEAEQAEKRGGKLRKRRRTFVIGDGSVAWLLSAGKHRLKMCRTVMGKTCGVLPLGVGAEGARVRTKGLEWDLNGERTSLGGFLSTSNHLADAEGVVEVETSEPVYWTVQLRTPESAAEESA